MKNTSIPKVVNFNLDKHLPQSSGARTNDLFFILSALYIAGKSELSLTKLTLEKTLFKTAQELAENKIHFLNTYFYVNTYGPHNNIFYSYLEELQKAGLIELEGWNIYLSPKGLRFFSDLIEKLPTKNEKLKKVLLALDQKINQYANNPAISITETHAQEVIDTTDDNQIKTIEQLIKEINPAQKFERSSQFKYIEPEEKKDAAPVKIPSEILNNLETTLANVEDVDFEQEGNLQQIFV